MKKTLLITVLTLFTTIAVLAQNDDPLIMEDFAKGIKGSNTFAFNDHLNVMQVTTDDDKFDLVAVNDKLEIVWRTSLAGYGIKTDKFQNKIVALASSDHSFFKGTTNTFLAYVIDPANGKVLAEKVVYKSTNDLVEFPQMYTGDGAFFKLAVRQSGFARKIHVGIPIYSLFTMNSYTREYNETRNLQVIEYNDKLDSISAFKPVISNGTFISLAWNKHADMFIGWLNGPTIEVYKYDAGKTKPSNMLTADVVFKEDKSIIPSEHFMLKPSDNSNVLYYSMIYVNEDKDGELGIGKLDFATNKKLYVAQALDKATLKAIKKSFVPVNKKIDDVDMGYGKGMKLLYMDELDGKVVTAIASHSTRASAISNGVFMIENSILINAYDQNLALKFQNVLPTGYIYPSRHLKTSFHFNKNKLYMVSNAKTGMTTLSGLFSILDIGNGQWDKMEYLSKKHISNSDYSDGSSVLWFSNNFIVPYLSPKMFSATKTDVTLQLNNY
ncbi:hypothetical protein IDJ77_10165 [Mucilaginibacter sp. ZT4R22]|uniref:Uncharacterized protein n=1 Tax=Mucilaginibacter pankratovii TaxID=2772110 RepID=A0ABR7WPS2_9SPHI|nr:hypothetical protein [Mucilaginibacter pankratovii]MBD1364173.1 hypothetical protein [Mucilaginibacter pankratovii]